MTVSSYSFSPRYPGTKRNPHARSNPSAATLPSCTVACSVQPRHCSAASRTRPRPMPRRCHRSATSSPSSTRWSSSGTAFSSPAGTPETSATRAVPTRRNRWYLDRTASGSIGPPRVNRRLSDSGEQARTRSATEPAVAGRTAVMTVVITRGWHTAGSMTSVMEDVTLPTRPARPAGSGTGAPPPVSGKENSLIVSAIPHRR